MLMTIGFSNNGLSLHMETNDLVGSTWAESYLKIDKIEKVDLQTNNQGIEIRMESGTAYWILFANVSQLDGVSVGEGQPIATEKQLYDTLCTLIGLN